MKHYKIYNINKNPVVCHIPHSSTRIPLEFKNDYLINIKSLNYFSKRMSDLYAELLYNYVLKKFGGIVSSISRVVVDFERFENDVFEPMSKVGMGALYIKNEEGEIIRKLNSKQKKFIIGKIYKPYHKELNNLVKHKIGKFGKCLILDCHTFPSIPRSYEPNQKLNRPDICIGADDFHTPVEIAKMLVNKFKNHGFSVKINNPFSGTIVPSDYYLKNKDVHSVMIEVNRKLYMNEEDFNLKEGYKEMFNRVNKILNRVINEFYE